MHRRGDSVWSAQAAQSEKRINVLIPEVKYRDIVRLSFEFVEEILWCGLLNESYSAVPFLGVLFIMLHKVVPTFESVDEILKCDHSNESYWAVLSFGTVYDVAQGGSNFWVCELKKS